MQKKTTKHKLLWIVTSVVFSTITVNVLKFRKLHLILFGVMFAFLCRCFLKIPRLALWNGKQCRPWSDCSFRSSLIWVCSLCICHFISNFAVPNFRTFTVIDLFFQYINYESSIPLTGGKKIPYHSIMGNVEFSDVTFNYPTRHEQVQFLLLWDALLRETIHISYSQESVICLPLQN